MLECAKRLEAQGFEVTYISPRPDGVVLPADVAEAVREDTFLVSVMSVNNEVGSIMDIPAISKAVLRNGHLSHRQYREQFQRVAPDLYQPAQHRFQKSKYLPPSK